MDNSAIVSLCFLLVLGAISGYHMYQSHILGENGVRDSRRLIDEEVSVNKRLGDQVVNIGESLTLCLQILENKSNMNCSNLNIDGIFEIRAPLTYIVSNFSNHTDFAIFMKRKLSEIPSVRIVEKCV